MVYIEVKFDKTKKQWQAATVFDGVRNTRCVNKNFNELMREANNWGRLLQARIQIMS